MSEKKVWRKGSGHVLLKSSRRWIVEVQYERVDRGSKEVEVEEYSL